MIVLDDCITNRATRCHSRSPGLLSSLLLSDLCRFLGLDEQQALIMVEMRALIGWNG